MVAEKKVSVTLLSEDDIRKIYAEEYVKAMRLNAPKQIRKTNLDPNDAIDYLAEIGYKCSLSQLYKASAKNEIPFSSHIMMCPLSVLCGSDIARGVLKPKKNNFKGYNALNDLLFLSRIQQIKAHAKKIFQEEKFNIEFLSLDSNLLLFFSLIETLDTTKNIDRIETIVSYDRKLFPDLKKEDYLRLMEDIDSNF